VVLGGAKIDILSTIAFFPQMGTVCAATNGSTKLAPANPIIHQRGSAFLTT
jgi:hypothetical protein